MDRTYRKVEWAAVDGSGDYVGPFSRREDAEHAAKTMPDGCVARRHTLTVISDWLAVSEEDTDE